MKNNRQIYISIGVILSVITLIAIFAFRQEAQSNRQNQDEPILDYESEIRKVVSKERKEKNGRFNSRGSPARYSKIIELPPGIEPLPTNSHWWIRLSALPIEQSNLIVVGQISNTEAHLSDNKTGIYSEFTVQVEYVFKDTSNLIKPNNSLVVNRVGGGVRFASGKVQRYRLNRQGVPQRGRRYFLFLRQTEAGDFMVLTGYETSNGTITPLDGEDNKDPKSNLPFARYRGVREQNFLQDLQLNLQSMRSHGGIE